LVYILRGYEQKFTIMVLWCVTPCDLVNMIPVSNHTTKLLHQTGTQVLSPPPW